MCVCVSLGLGGLLQPPLCCSSQGFGAFFFGAFAALRALGSFFWGRLGSLHPLLLTPVGDGGPGGGGNGFTW